MKSKKILVLILVSAILYICSCQNNEIKIFGLDEIPEKYISFAVYGIDGEEIITDAFINFNYKKNISVADLSRDICRESGIPLVFSNTVMGTYVQGINSLFEFDNGAGSGWIYSVNGEYQGTGCGAYILSDGDCVEWRYTLDFGKDIGAFVLDE